MKIIDISSFNFHKKASLRKWQAALKSKDMQDAYNWFMKSDELDCGFCKIMDIMSSYAGKNKDCDYCPCNLFEIKGNPEILCRVWEWQKILRFFLKKDFSNDAFEAFKGYVNSLLKRINKVTYADYVEYIGGLNDTHET